MIMEVFVEKRATKLLAKGRAAVQSGDYITALHEFKAAAYVQKTPAALTNWGTMEHCLGDTQRAMELCREAISMDPECGSAYNDIGFYLVALGRADDAIPWFKKAIVTKNLEEPRHIPWINLGKLYLERKEFHEALHHFDEALRLDPSNNEARDLAQSIRDRMQ